MNKPKPRKHPETFKELFRSPMTQLHPAGTSYHTRRAKSFPGQKGVECKCSSKEHEGQLRCMLWIFGQLWGTWSTVAVNAEASYAVHWTQKWDKHFCNFHLETKPHRFCYWNKDEKVKVNHYFVLQEDTSIKLHLIYTEVSGTLIFKAFLKMCVFFLMPKIVI